MSPDPVTSMRSTIFCRPSEVIYKGRKRQLKQGHKHKCNYTTQKNHAIITNISYTRMCVSTKRKALLSNSLSFLQLNYQSSSLACIKSEDFPSPHFERILTQKFIQTTRNQQLTCKPGAPGSTPVSKIAITTPRPS